MRRSRCSLRFAVTTIGRVSWSSSARSERRRDARQAGEELGSIREASFERLLEGVGCADHECVGGEEASSKGEVEAEVTRGAPIRWRPSNDRHWRKPNLPWLA